MKNNLFINLEIKDYVIRFVEWNAETRKIVKFGEHYISRGIISNGMIEDRDEFLKIIRMLSKKWRLKRKQIRMTMPMQRLLFENSPFLRRLLRMKFSNT